MSTVSTRGDIKSQRQSRNWIFGREIADGSISKTILKRTVKRIWRQDRGVPAETVS